MQRDPNYGRPDLSKEGDAGAWEESTGLADGRDPSRLDQGLVGGGIGVGDERAWSMLSHLSFLLNFVTGIGGLVAPVVIWLFYKERSGRIAFHALQSLWYQVAWVGIGIAYATVTVVLSLLTFGLAAVVLVPLAFLVFLIPLIHQVYAAIKVNGGANYRYPIIADIVDREKRFV